MQANEYSFIPVSSSHLMFFSSYFPFLLPLCKMGTPKKKWISHLLSKNLIPKFYFSPHPIPTSPTQILPLYSSPLQRIFFTSLAAIINNYYMSPVVDQKGTTSLLLIAHHPKNVFFKASKRRGLQLVTLYLPILFMWSLFLQLLFIFLILLRMMTPYL